jgi:LmbE family N-acetylglucosaminyl deacetylase
VYSLVKNNTKGRLDINMNYLVVVAHPDDEVLGAGASIYKLTKEGNHVSVCILSGEVTARNARPEIEDLVSDMNRAAEILGIKQIICGSFPNIEFNTVPHLKLVQFIENTIINTKAEIVFTHHPIDLNNDHYHTSIACQTAVRLFQRRPEISPIKELLFMETLSATEWGLNSSMKQFTPNTFIEVGEEGINKKIEALQQYRDVMREYPHPRSTQAIKGLAAYRGGQSGFCYAEAFESVFRREDCREE